MSEDRSAAVEPEEPQRAVARLASLAPWLMVLVTCALVLPGLGDNGFWTVGELPILDRTLAALGEPRSELLRSPWLPDQLRTWCFAAFGRSDLGLRLPGALAGVGLVVLTLLLARRSGASALHAALAGGFALVLPLLLASSRTLLGAATGELWVSGAAIALVHALDEGPGRLRRGAVRVLVGLLGLACLAAATASLGIVLGACLPLSLVAVASVSSGSGRAGFELSRHAVLAASLAAAIAGFVGLWLVRDQGEGYIALLGAAKDLELLEEPGKWAFTDTLERLGYQLFPITGLVVFGLAAPGRARWPALWLGVAVVLCSLWSMVYGTTVCPVTIPAALVAAAACERMLDTREPITARRMVVFCAVLAALILAKDAGRTPQHIAAPLIELSQLEFPTQAIAGGESFGERLSSLAKRFAALVLLVHCIAPPGVVQRRLRREREPLADASQPLWRRAWASILDRCAVLGARLDARASAPRIDRARGQLAALLLLAGLCACAQRYVALLDEVSEQLSIAAPLARFEAAVAAGELPNDQLALHRVRDPGLAHYGPGEARELILTNRPELNAYLGEDAPHTALVRRKDIPALFKAAHREQRALYVLDDAHHDYILVANFLPPGREDLSPLREVVYDEAITLAHPTYVSWEPYVELVGWEIEGELHRGATVTMHLVFRVLRSMPAGSKLYARLQRGKTSRVAAKPQELTGGVFPPNYWSTGQYIHHAVEIEVPWLEVLPGEHEFVIGLRRSEKTNFKIMAPSQAQPESEFGVKLRGKSDEFVVVGTVDMVW